LLRQLAAEVWTSWPAARIANSSLAIFAPRLPGCQTNLYGHRRINLPDRLGDGANALAVGHPVTSKNCMIDSTTLMVA